MEERKERREGKGKREREEEGGERVITFNVIYFKMQFIGVYIIFRGKISQKKQDLARNPRKRSWSLFRCKRSHRKSQAKRPNHKHTSRSCLYGYYISRVPSKLVQQII